MPNIPENAEILSQTEYEKMIQKIIFIGENTDKDIAFLSKSPCEAYGVYWIKT